VLRHQGVPHWRLANISTLTANQTTVNLRAPIPSLQYVRQYRFSF